MLIKTIQEFRSVGAWNISFCAHYSSSKIRNIHLRLFRPDQGPHTVHLIETCQRAKKVMSDSPGLMDVANRQMNSVLNLPNRQMFLRKFRLQKGLLSILLIKVFEGLIKRTLGLVHVSCSSPKCQAVKLTCGLSHFASCSWRFYLRWYLSVLIFWGLEAI